LDGYYLCPVCFWEDSAGDDPDQPSIGNHGLTLTIARANFAAFGACEPRFVGNVRPPRPHELPVGEETSAHPTD
jgi:hypothetical protein